MEKAEKGGKKTTYVYLAFFSKNVPVFFQLFNLDIFFGRKKRFGVATTAMALVRCGAARGAGIAQPTGAAQQLMRRASRKPRDFCCTFWLAETEKTFFFNV